MPYYIVEVAYVGPYQDRHVDADRVDIDTVPVLTNMGCEPITDGWAGTTDDWCVTARGEYKTLGQAREALGALYPQGLRQCGAPPYHDETVESYRIGALEPMGWDWSWDWCYDDATARITADTIGEEIVALIEEWSVTARAEGLALHTDAAALLCRRLRDDRRADADASEAESDQ